MATHALNTAALKRFLREMDEKLVARSNLKASRVEPSDLEAIDFSALNAFLDPIQRPANG